MKRKLHVSLDWFSMFCIACLLLRLYLAKAVPVYAFVSAAHDDLWCYNCAFSLVKGQWLGTYNELTLTKGITFPVFLAVTYISEIPYSIMLALTQAVTAWVFVTAVKPLIRNRYMRGILFLLMIYAPVTMDYASAERVYRNSLTWPVALAVISGFTAVYLRIREKPSAAWYIYTGISLFAFVNLREDALWLYPFAGCAVLLTVLSFFMGRKEKRTGFRNLVFLVIPFAVTVIGNLGICALNYHYYGVFTRNDRSGTAFRTVCEDLLNTACDGNEDPADVWVSRDQYEKAIDASQTLSEIKDELMTQYDAWAVNHIDDGQCDGDFYVWALRCGAVQAGYYTDARTTADLWEKAAEELGQAFEDGRLEKSDGLLLSFSSRKLKTGDIGPLLADTVKDFYTSACGRGYVVQLTTVTDAESLTEIREFEAFLHDFMICDPAFMDGEEDDIVNAAGYIVSIENLLIRVYQAFSVPMLLLIPVSIVCCVLLMIRTPDKEIRVKLLRAVILSVGIFLSALLMQAMVTWFVSFIHNTEKRYIFTFYASPVRPMAALAALLPAMTCGQILAKIRKHKE